MILPREGAAMKERLSLMREVCLYLVIFLILFAYLFPLIWQLSTSLKTMDEVFRGFSLIPSKPIWENYTVALRDFNVGAYLLNTMLVAGLITVGQVISCSMAGYAFAKLRFPGRDFIFFLYLGTMMIPATVTLIPSYIIILSLGWMDSLPGLVVPFIFGNAFGTFLIRQFLQGVPKDLEEAAEIDGAGYFVIWARIMIPIAKPALATLAVMTLVSQWNSLVWPLIVTQSDKWKVLSVGLAAFRLFRAIQWNSMMAAVVMASLPMIIILFLAQRFFIQGIQFSGLNR